MSDLQMILVIVCTWVRSWLPARGEALPTAGSDFWSMAGAVGCPSSARVLQVVDSWCRSNATHGKIRHRRDGAWWMWLSYAKWQRDYLPWLSVKQVGDLIRGLEARGLLVGHQYQIGQSKWYRVDYAALSALMPSTVAFEGVTRSVQGGYETGTRVFPKRTGGLRDRDGINESTQSNHYNKSTQLNHSSSPPPTRSDFDKNISRKGIDFDRALEIARSRGARNPEAYAAKILKNAALQANGTPPPTPPRTQGGEQIKRGNPFAAQINEFKRSASPPPSSAPPPSPTVSEVWEAAKGQLQLQMDRANFESWIKGAVCVEDSGDRIVLAARNEYQRDQLQHRLARSIKRVVGDVAGHEVDVSFVVAEGRKTG